MLHDLFDPDHYRRQTGFAGNDSDCLTHFRLQGDSRGIDPSAYFSTVDYKRRYPDWAESGATTAVDDFLLQLQEGRIRQPHPLIDPDSYRAAYPDLAGLGPDIALHFIRHGDAEGRSPSADFDAGFYRQCYLPLEATHPFRHYATAGAARGFLPRPLPRDVVTSTTAMRVAVGGMGRPILLVAHDAQSAGVPILTLDLARALRAGGFDPVFLLCRAGPLVEQFAALGPVFVLAEGWDIHGLAAGLPGGAPCLINTGVAAGTGAALAGAGLDCLIHVHEMTAFLREGEFIADLRRARDAGARIAVSMPRMVAGLSRETGFGTAEIDVLQPGVSLPPTGLAAFRAARNWRESGKRGPVFIGAGYGDRRKGLDLFLSAAQRIRTRRPEARFVWLGDLGSWGRDLATQAQATGLDLTLPGFVTDTLAWYRAADLYLLTSRQDPGPTTAIHAAAVGTPFLGYAHDIGMIGLTGGIGDFLPPGDEVGFADAAVARAEAASGVIERRMMRREVRARTGFATYVAAVLSRFGHGPVDEA